MTAVSTPAAAPTSLATAPRWQVRLLGGLHLSDGTQQLVRLPSRAITALLARLALAPERAHPREELVELLWPGVAAEVGRNRLRQALSSLKALLEPPGCVAGPVLQADRLQVRVVDGAIACDARLFEQMIRMRRHAEARALYRGELLPGFYDEWIDEERLRLAALFDRLPADEPSVRAAPAALLPAAALAAPPPAVLDVGRATLPTYLTRVFGCELQAARLRALVAENRLVTLIGPGGSGKTRLAVEVARSLRDPPAGLLPGGHGAARPFDQVVFVSLVGCGDEGQFVDALLAALQVKASAQPPVERLADVLPSRRLLIVLDNFEQLVGVADRAIARLVAMLPQLHLLVTSRQVLGIDGERELSLAPLALPAAGAALEEAAANPAVALFVDRARAARADFHLGARNHAAIVELVQVLEGMPLAIELAASRVRSHAPAEMLARLRAAPGGTPQLDLLSRSGPRGGLDARHASMLRVVEWSWQQLGADAARRLAALAVFHGGFSRDAAEALWRDAAGHDPMLLDDLHGRSLVQSRETATGALRFALSEPIREFSALHHRAEAASWRARHRAWMRDYARALPVTPSLAHVREEIPNLLAALASALQDDDPDVAIDTLLAFGRCLEDVDLPDQGLAHARALVERCSAPARRCSGHVLLSTLLFHAGQGDAADLHAERGLAAAPDDPLLKAQALHALARLRWRRDRRADLAEPMLEAARTLLAGRDACDVGARIDGLQAVIADVHHRDHDRAEALHLRALRCWERLGNLHAINTGRYYLATSAQEAGRNRLALERLEEVIAGSVQSEDWFRLSQAQNVRGNALTALRRWPDSVEAFRESVRVAWQTMSPYMLAFPLWNLPRSLAHVGRPEPALRIAAFIAMFWQSRFGRLSDADRHDLRRVRRLVALQLPPAQCARLWAEGERLALADAVALALDPSA